jgi:hypothetical protein
VLMLRMTVRHESSIAATSSFKSSPGHRWCPGSCRCHRLSPPGRHWDHSPPARSTPWTSVKPSPSPYGKPFCRIDVFCLIFHGLSIHCNNVRPLATSGFFVQNFDQQMCLTLFGLRFQPKTLGPCGWRLRSCRKLRG